MMRYFCISCHDNNSPISLLFDEYTEKLSFPAIYLGHFTTFHDELTISPFQMASSELSRTYRHAVMPHHLLYVGMKIIRLRVRNLLNVAYKFIGKIHVLLDNKLNLKSTLIVASKAIMHF